MKESILFFASLATLSFINTVQATNVPEMTASLNECLTWANSQEGPAAVNAALTRCYALQDCFANQSEDEEALRECQEKAEVAFLQSFGGEAPQNPNVTSEVAATSGVVTEPADSYYQQDSDRKGWRESDVGR